MRRLVTGHSTERLARSSTEARCWTLARWAAALALTCSAIACQRTPPKRVQLELAPLSLTTDPIRAVLWAWDQNNAKSVAKDDVTYAITPADLASARPDGQIACLRSGDGEVSATLHGVSGKAPLRCRIVESIDLPPQLGRVDLADGAVALQVTVLGKGGEPLSDVPVSFDTKNLSVVRKEGDKLVPLQVGDAKLTARAGNASKEFSLQVVRRLQPEALPIDGNRRIHYSLQPGKYELTVQLAAPKKLTAEWRSAPYCNYSATAAEHKSVCVLRAKGGVVFDNPAFLDSGATTVSHAGVSLLEVP